MNVNAAVRFHLDATPAPLRFPIAVQADLRDAWAVLSCAGTQWFFYSRRNCRFLRLPVSDLDGRSPAQVAAIVEDALDRLHLLPAIHPAARSA